MKHHWTPEDEGHMRRALELAGRARGCTSPNPMVGCVITRESKILGEGYHARAGEPHAEVHAVREAGGDLHGATVYVTLEPCCHEGRTPPCTELLIRHKPARVVAAMEDPNPLVSGKGLALLRAAGIQVDLGLLQEEAQRLNECFVKYVTTGMPFVIAKCAMTLDGKIATHTGHSRWVTGEAARRRVHELRNQVDAIMAGSRTVMLDDPSLTTRLGGGRGKDPVRIILDADAYLDSDRQVFHLDSAAPTWVVAPEGSPAVEGDAVLRIPPGPGGVDMRALMRELGSREITSVLIEGGGATHASAFEAGVVDKVMFFIAPKIIGGRDAVTAVEGDGAARMEDAILLDQMTAEPVGEDILVEAYVRRA